MLDLQQKLAEQVQLLVIDLSGYYLGIMLASKDCLASVLVFSSDMLPVKPSSIASTLRTQVVLCLCVMCLICRCSYSIS